MALIPFLFDLDDLPVLDFEIVTREGDSYDLTGATVTLLVAGLGEFACAIDDAELGQCSRTVNVGDFPHAGRYRSQLRVDGAGPTYHTDVFVMQIAESINTTNVFAVPPTFSPATGGVVFGFNGQLGQDLSNFFWDDTRNNLQLFGGTPGTSIAKALILGVGSAPSTRPANTVQVVARQLSGAGTAGLYLYDEMGGTTQLGSTTTSRNAIALTGQDSSTIALATGPGGGAVEGTTSAALRVGGTDALVAVANGVVEQRIGTDPGAITADRVQEFVVDLAGAGTAGKKWRDETNHTHTMGRLISTQVADGALYAKVGGQFHLSSANQGTPANTTQTVLHTITFPANTTFTLDDQSAYFFFQGSLASNGNNKTIRLWINGTTGTLIVDSGTIATNNADWMLEGRIRRTSATAVSAYGTFRVGPAGAGSGAVSVHRFGVASATSGSLLTSTLTLDLSGQNGSASANDIRCFLSKAIWEPV